MIKTVPKGTNCGTSTTRSTRARTLKSPMPAVNQRRYPAATGTERPHPRPSRTNVDAATVRGKSMNKVFQGEVSKPVICCVVGIVVVAVAWYGWNALKTDGERGMGGPSKTPQPDTRRRWASTSRPCPHGARCGIPPGVQGPAPCSQNARRQRAGFGSSGHGPPRGIPACRQSPAHRVRSKVRPEHPTATIRIRRDR